MSYKEKQFSMYVEKKGLKFRVMLAENDNVQFMTKYFLLFALVLVIGVFGILNPNFLNLYNILNILKTASIVGLISIAAMINLNSGAINFCLGTQSTLTAAIIAVLLERYTGNYLLAVIAGVAAGMLVGGICSLFINVMRVPAFIATLSISTILFVIDQELTGGSEMFSTNWPLSYTFIGRTKVFGMIPLPVIIFFALGGICWFVMERTRLGRLLYACGASSVTSKQVGINIGKMKFIAFMIGSFLLATAGLVQTSVLNSVNPTMGNDLLIPAISSAMLGATFLRPGKYNVPGTMIAAFLTTSIKLGVAGLGAGSFVSDILQGIILIIAVGFIALVREEGLPKVSLT
ncbi:MAG: ABC transporter permease [Mobilitalea sp.]